MLPNGVIWARFTDRYNFEQIYYGNWIAKELRDCLRGAEFYRCHGQRRSVPHKPFSRAITGISAFSPLGGKIFALASVANEPLGIWSFDIDSGDLHNLVPPERSIWIQ